jgi:hypothetical protein
MAVKSTITMLLVPADVPYMVYRRDGWYPYSTCILYGHTCIWVRQPALGKCLTNPLKEYIVSVTDLPTTPQWWLKHGGEVISEGQSARTWQDPFILIFIQLFKGIGLPLLQAQSSLSAIIYPSGRWSAWFGDVQDSRDSLLPLILPWFLYNLQAINMIKYKNHIVL